MTEIIIKFLKPELIILVPVLYFIAEGIKKTKIKNDLIPISLGIIGILLSYVYTFSVSEITCIQDIFNIIFISFTQGILVASGSVYINEIIKHIK